MSATAATNTSTNASKPANAAVANESKVNANATSATNAANASKSTNAAALAAVANTSSNQEKVEKVEVSVGNKNYTCVIRKIDENKNAKNGEIVVTKNGQKYAVTVTEPSKVNGGRIKRVTRNQKKKKTRSTRK